MKKFLIVAIAVVQGFIANSQLLPVPLDTTTASRNQTPRLLTPFNNALYFIAQDGSHGTELWNYTGSGMPAMVHDLNPGTQPGASLQDFEHMAVIGSTLYYAGNNAATGIELYKYSGSGIPSIAKEINTGANASNVKNLVAIGSKVYFSAWQSGNGTELFEYDPATNTVTLHDITSVGGGGEPKNLTVMNGKLYFQGTADTGGTELLMFDPANNNITIAANIEAGNMGSYPQNLTVIGNDLYFTATTTVYGREVYRFDGTTATRITDLNAGSGNGISFTSTPNVTKIAGYNGDIYFGGDDGTGAQKLYKYSVSTGNVATISTISNITTGYPPYGFITFNGKLYFAADDATNGSELWSYDGSNASMVTNLAAGNAGANFSDPMIWNNNLFFSASNGNGHTLFKLGSTTGVQSVFLDGQVRVYPNPATHTCFFTLQLNTATACLITLYDASGKLVYNRSLREYPAGKTDTEIPMSALSAGTYFYSVTNNKNQVLATGRLVK